jgi:hypothetical protein
MVLLDSRGISRVPRYSGTCPASQQGFRLRGCHPLWPAVPGRSTILLVGNLPALRPDRPYNPREQAPWFGLFRVRSPLLAESLFCFLFLWVLRWFTSPRWLPPTYGFSRGFLGMTRGGLPHSEIAGSKPVCGSPTLIAAYHVLLRLLAPRHSPYALSSLTISELTHTGTGNQDSGVRNCLLSPDTRLRQRQSDHTAFMCGLLTTVCRIFSCQRTLVRLRQGYGGQPSSGLPIHLRASRCGGQAVGVWPANRSSPGFPPASEGWWRIPGSNR